MFVAVDEGSGSVGTTRKTSEDCHGLPVLGEHEGSVLFGVVDEVLEPVVGDDVGEAGFGGVLLHGERLMEKLEESGEGSVGGSSGSDFIVEVRAAFIALAKLDEGRVGAESVEFGSDSSSVSELDWSASSARRSSSID